LPVLRFNPCVRLSAFGDGGEILRHLFRARFCRYDGFSIVFAHCEVEGLAAINVLPGFGFTLAWMFD
jgi:hypothetical protein